MAGRQEPVLSPPGPEGPRSEVGPTATSAAVPRRTSAARIVAWIVPLVLVAVVVGAVYLLGHAAFLRWSLQWAVDRSEGRLAVEDVSGTLFDGVRIGSIRWRDFTEDGEVELTVRDARGFWSPGELLAKELRIGRLRAASALLKLPPGDGPMTQPAILDLPINLRLDELAIDQLRIEKEGHDPIELQKIGLRGQYRGDKDTPITGYRVDRLVFASAWGDMELSGSLGDKAPYAVTALGKWVGRLKQLSNPVVLRFGVKGPLADMVVNAQTDVATPTPAPPATPVGRGRGSPAADGKPVEPAVVPALPGQVTLRAQVRPFEADMLSPIDFEARSIEPGQLGAPGLLAQLNLAGRVRIGDDRIAGDLRFTNGAAGAVTTEGPTQIPVQSGVSDFTWRGERVTLSRMKLELPKGAGIDGQMTIQLDRQFEVFGARLPGLQARLELRDIDFSVLSEPLAPTRLAGKVELDDTRFDIDLRDSSRDDLALAARGRLDGEQLLLERARIATLAAAESAQIARERPGQAARARGTPPPARKAPLPPVASATAPERSGHDAAALAKIPGEMTAAGRIEVRRPYAFDLVGQFRQFDPSRVLADPRWRGVIAGTWGARGQVVPVIDIDSRLTIDRGALGGRNLRADWRGNVRFESTAPGSWRIANSKLQATYGEVRVETEGNLGAAGDRLAFRTQVDELAQIDAGWHGRLNGHGEIRGLPPAVAISAELDGSRIVADGIGSAEILSATLEIPEVGAGRLVVRADGRRVRIGAHELDALRVDAGGTADAHEFRVNGEGAGITARATGSGRLDYGNPVRRGEPLWRWGATVREFAASGPLRVNLVAPATLEATANSAQIQNATFAIDDGRLQVARLVVGNERFEATGEATNVPVQRLLAAAGRADLLRGEGVNFLGVKINGRWDVAGSSVDDLDGKVNMRLSGGPTPDGSGLADVALREGQLSGRLELQVPSLGFANRLVGPLWSAAGRMRFAGNVGGTLAAPRLEGDLSGENLRLEQRGRGWVFDRGTLVGRLEGDRLALKSMKFATGAGSIEMTGDLRLPAAQTISTSGQEMQGRFVLRADKLVLPLGPGQRLVISGETEVLNRGASFVLTGRLRADEGLIELRGGEAPTLPADVVVADPNAPAPQPKPSEDEADDEPEPRPIDQKFEISSELALDLGDRLRVRGSGVDAMLTGVVNLRGKLPDGPRAFGIVNVRRGTYAAYGKQLEIDHGRLIFNGPLDNPSLDIVAVRRDDVVEAGVALTGSVLSPRVRLVSRPEVPDAEKLSWLVLGLPLADAQSTGQIAALQTAAATLLGRNDGSLVSGLASALGVDVLTLRGASSATGFATGPGLGITGLGASVPTTMRQAGSSEVQPSAVGQNVIAVGKRLSSRLFVTYEQGLRGVWNLLRVQYDITQRLSVRALTGSESALDVLYFYAFD